MTFSSENWQPRHQFTEKFDPTSPEYLEQQVDILVSKSLSYARAMSDTDFATITWNSINELEISDAYKLLITAESLARSIEGDMAFHIYAQHPISDPDLISVAHTYKDALRGIGLVNPLRTEHSVESRTDFSSQEATPQIVALALKELLNLRVKNPPIDSVNVFTQVESTINTLTPIYETPLTNDLSLHVVLHRRRERGADRMITTNKGTFSFALYATDPDGILAGRLQSERKAEEQRRISMRLLFTKDRPGVGYFKDPHVFYSEKIELQCQTPNECIAAFQLAHEDFKDITPERDPEVTDHTLVLESNDGLYNLEFSWGDTGESFNVVATRTEKYLYEKRKDQKEFVRINLPAVLINKLSESKDESTHQFHYPYPNDTSGMPSILMGTIPWDIVHDEIRTLLPVNPDLQKWVERQELIGVTERITSPIFENDVIIEGSTLRIGWRVVYETPIFSTTESIQSYEPHVYCWNSAT